MAVQIGNDNISLLDQEEVDHSEEAVSHNQKISLKDKAQPNCSKSSKKTHPCNGENIQLKLVAEMHNDKILVAEQGQKLSDMILEIKNKIESPKDKQPIFSIDFQEGAIKLVANKPIPGKVGSPMAYSIIKKKLSHNPEMRRLHSGISGYGDMTPAGAKARPKQLLSPEMVNQFIEQRIADEGGINTMLTTLEKEVLVPIEEAFNALPNLYPTLAGQDFSAGFKELLEGIIRAQFGTLPSVLYLLTHLYNNSHKLLALGKSTARSKEQLAQGAGQAKKKFIPQLFSKDEIKRRETILSRIEKLIERVGKLMNGISFLKAAPKYKPGKFETYWNQDLELTPGALVFEFGLPAPVLPVASNVVPLVSAHRSSVELADKTTDTDSKMVLEDQQSLSDPEGLEDDCHSCTALEKSLFGLGSSPTPQRSRNVHHSSEENPNAFPSDLVGFLADDNTAQSVSFSFEAELFVPDFGYDLSMQQHQEFAETHQTTDFISN